MKEIERKFLVKSADYRKDAAKKIYFMQAYLNTDPERTIRIRISNENAYITIKGKSTADGLTRFEWEKKIGVKEAKRLIGICEPGQIEKNRYLVPERDHIFEVDEFLGENQGLVIAEIELQDEKEKFSKPDWLGEEVTGNLDYYNSNLIKRPYKTWKQ